MFLLRIVTLVFLVRAAGIVGLHVYPCPRIYHQDDPEAEHFARTLTTEHRWTNPYLPEDPLPSALRAPLPSLLLAGLWVATSGDEYWFHLATYGVYTLVSVATVATWPSGPIV